MRNLEDHLAFYGISRSDSDGYWNWAGGRLGEAKAREIDSLREQITSRGSKKKPEVLNRFYSLMADPEIASIIHSMKADAIRASGAYVQLRIEGRKKVLDLGCGLGYLTSWYAFCDQTRTVLGVDFSGSCILEAQQKARDMGIINVDFQALEIDEFFARQASRKEFAEADYDAVIDTQTVHMTFNIDRVFRAIRSVMKKDGVFVSVPVLETARQARAFLNSMTRAGLKLRSFDFVYYSDCGVRGAYPAFVAGLTGSSLTVDMDGEYEKAWRVLYETPKV